MDSPQPKPPRLLEQVRNRIRYLHYSRKTELSYLSWIRRYILFHNKKHPREMGAEDVAAYMNYLATRRHVSASTQNQALNAINFMYRQVLNLDMGECQQLIHARRPKKLPVVLTPDEVASVMNNLTEPHWTMVALMYGCGLRFMECLRQFVFASRSISLEPGTGKRGRHHINEKSAQRIIRHAIREAGIQKHATCHSFRHSFATQLLESGYDIRTVQELLGHSHVNTTMIFTHVLNRGGKGVVSPLDALRGLSKKS